MKHGAYSTSAVAIPSGQFAENEVEISAYIEALIASLHPRDAIEHEQAHRIALYFQA